MSYRERIKELGTLGSIGMGKKQKRNMLLKEAFIVGTIGIIIGLLLGTLISFFEIRTLDILAKNIGESSNIDRIIINQNTKFEMVIPMFGVISAICITYIIVFISCTLPLKKINKVSEIDAIRGNINNSVKSKTLKTPKLIVKLLKQEGHLAYKNMRKDKSKYKTIVVSIVISVTLFITINTVLIDYLEKRGEIIDDSVNNKELSISLNEDDGKEVEETIINRLKEKNLLKNYIMARNVYVPNTSNMLSVSSEKLTKGAELLNNREAIYFFKDNTSIATNCQIMYFSGEEFAKFLQENEIGSLGDTDCILIDKTQSLKNGNLTITNLQEGDNLDIIITNRKLEKVNSKDKNINKDEMEKEQEYFNMLGISNDSNQSQNVDNDFYMRKNLNIKKVIHNTKLIRNS